MKNRMNTNKLKNTDMMNSYSQMSMLGNIQKIGKGKRKYKVNIDKNSKKYLARLIVEMKKQMGIYATNPQTKGVIDYLNYLQTECNKKNNDPVMMSFEELEFLKKTIRDSVKAMEDMKFKWYQFFRKITVKLMLTQNKYLLEELNK
ncbi:hypothetical protein EV215_1725 [Hypnocyclicus thermotrophus]|uniref:Uncharacterized protein n=1 Tax=Hypnocyclicus thermotrophus TaxID=1627895 RepID=A0AA46DXB0_9FUSO|nr:hypothetical protein [Hypnocyclicus thermotrophus]TDT68005.1 hypothetical protein EV215_1725 [Hypnocyclicus thermotrophus]